MPLKGFCLYFALLGLMQTTTSVVVMILSPRAVLRVGAPDKSRGRPSVVCGQAFLLYKGPGTCYNQNEQACRLQNKFRNC